MLRCSAQDQGEGEPTMDDEIELFTDGEGLALFGETSAIDRFLESRGLKDPVESFDLAPILNLGSASLKAGAEIAANHGRWLLLTEESAAAIQEIGLVPTTSKGIAYAMVGERGDISQWVKVIRSPGAIFTNPALLAGVGGLMAQFALQRQLRQISDHLESIDRKVAWLKDFNLDKEFAVLRGIRDSVERAKAVRSALGRVTDTSWSTIQDSPRALAERHALALLQLDRVTYAISQASSKNLAEAAPERSGDVRASIVLAAETMLLLDQVADLELDRALNSSPEEVEATRQALTASRHALLERTTECFNRLLSEVDASSHRVNNSVLINPRKSPRAFAELELIRSDVNGILSAIKPPAVWDPIEQRKWSEAATPVVESVIRFGQIVIPVAQAFR